MTEQAKAATAPTAAKLAPSSAFHAEPVLWVRHWNEHLFSFAVSIWAFAWAIEALADSTSAAALSRCACAVSCTAWLTAPDFTSAICRSRVSCASASEALAPASWALAAADAAFLRSLEGVRI